ncbi:hypothetical protein HQ545_08050 [Candidatus Woesearchaeota archaeon]|nr:hypothetical protein [Candidatus Woesearchaeota archaeon]
MSKRLYLIGSNHCDHDFKWLLEQIQEIQPDCITLEQKIDTAGGIRRQFEHPLDQILKRHQETSGLFGEFAAGIYHARQNNIPVFCIDEYQPFYVALLADMNQGDNYAILGGKKHLQLNYHTLEETKFENATRRNKFMGIGIDYFFQVNKYNKIVHIGGREHYDRDRCVPLQDIVIANSIQIIDAVNKTRVNHPTNSRQAKQYAKEHIQQPTTI